jgi:hypothetical protein
MTMQNAPDEPEEHRPVYGYMERQLIFKLLAAHAMVDGEFFEQLHDDPREAASQLRIDLTDADVEYINGVDWQTLSENAESIRNGLNLEQVTNSW